MGWHKRNNAYDVYVYDPAVKKKRYVGRRALERDARALFREKTDEFARDAQQPAKGTTIAEYAEEWLRDHHGPGTKRPRQSTWKVNRINLNPLLGEFGSRALDGGIARREALAWSRSRRHIAKTVSAMFNDAVDEELCGENPFANRKQEQSRGRKDIHPMTEDEVELISDIALRSWGRDGYGITARAWVLFGAWVGCRPGEMFRVSLEDMNLVEGSVRIHRVKKRGGVYPVDTVAFPQAARDAARAIPDIPRQGPVFVTVTGRPFSWGAFKYHWRPIRDAFREKVGERRWAELIVGQESLDYYTLRHYVASVMADRGADARDIAAQLGNSVQVCQETYIHGFKDRQLERNRRVLEQPTVVDLDAARMGRISG